MSPDELHKRLLALFGPVATDRKAAAALRVDPSTVRRWLGGQRRIPGPVIAYLEEREKYRRLVSGLANEQLTSVRLS